MFYRKRLYRKYSVAFRSRENGFFFDKFGIPKEVGSKNTLPCMVCSKGDELNYIE